LSAAPGNTGVASLRAAEPSETDAIQAVWESSYSHDDPASWARGGWSADAWATDSRVLVLAGRVIGVAAVRAELAPDGAMPARIALEVSARQKGRGATLVQGAVDLVRAAGGGRIRLFLPSGAIWIEQAAQQAGFKSVRTIAHMLLPAAAPTPLAAPVAGMSLRSIRPGEDRQVLEALNRAWTGTWNFVEITFEMLEEDLRGQRDGMLLGVDASDRIIATCHAVFDPGEQNPDGNPRAWISNLTVDPEFRQRGVARAMLSAGIAHLRSCGASSITLGVDADDPAPFRLYQSVGFEIASGMQAWDKAL
jgi:ribosomal protein S18 acetylase RimI-like enzyme